MDDCQVAPIPRCPVHGLLRYRSEIRPLGGGLSLITSQRWVCHGWDGEGCDYAVNHDDLPWRSAEYAGIIQDGMTAQVAQVTVIQWQT